MTKAELVALLEAKMGASVYYHTMAGTKCDTLEAQVDHDIVTQQACHDYVQADLAYQQALKAYAAEQRIDPSAMPF